MVQDRRLFLPRGSPNSMSRTHRSDMLQLITVIGAFLTLLWSLVSGFPSFLNVSVLNERHDTRLAVFYLIMGSIYMGVVVIEVFGIFVAAKRKVVSIRIFAYLSILVTLMIVADGIIHTIVHYKFKNEILDACSNVNFGERIYFTAFFGPIYGGLIGEFVHHSDVAEWCMRRFNNDSLSALVCLPITSLMSALFVVFVFAYFRELHAIAVNDPREPVRMADHPARYSPPFQNETPKAPSPNMDMSDHAFVPPYESDDTKPPMYEGGDFKGRFDDQKDDPFWGGHHKGNL